jgi:hypothetical protein
MFEKNHRLHVCKHSRFFMLYLCTGISRELSVRLFQKFFIHPKKKKRHAKKGLDFIDHGIHEIYGTFPLDDANIPVYSFGTSHHIPNVFISNYLTTKRNRLNPRKQSP